MVVCKIIPKNGTNMANRSQRSIILRDEVAGKSALTVADNVAVTSIVVKLTLTIALK